MLNKNDLRYLYKLDSYLKLPKEAPEYKLWEDIFWDYVDKKGISSRFKVGLELKAKLAILESESIFECKNNHTKIEMLKIKIKDYIQQDKKNNDLENDAILSKFMGFPIKPKKLTVLEYIGFEKLLIESNKKAEELNGKRNHR